LKFRPHKRPETQYHFGPDSQILRDKVPGIPTSSKTFSLKVLIKIGGQVTVPSYTREGL